LAPDVEFLFGEKQPEPSSPICLRRTDMIMPARMMAMRRDFEAQDIDEDDEEG
jgi:hypothetical protein